MAKTSTTRRRPREATSIRVASIASGVLRRGYATADEARPRGIRAHATRARQAEAAPMTTGRAARAAFVVAAIVIWCATSGCAARVNRAMESWKGHNVSELIASWGPPQQVIELGPQGKVYTWLMTRSYTTPGTASTITTGSANGFGNYAYGSAHSTTTYTAPQTTTWQASRSFWIDENGTVYRWAWRGL